MEPGHLRVCIDHAHTPECARVLPPPPLRILETVSLPWCLQFESNPTDFSFAATCPGQGETWLV